MTTLTDFDASLISIGGPSFVASEADYGANGRELNGFDGNPAVYDPSLGWTMNATITPSTSDISGGQARLIMEIGGTSNGTGLWLIDGVPTLALKTAVQGAEAFLASPSSLVANDLDLSDNAAAIYSSFGQLTAGVEYSVAASWDQGDGFSLAVQDDSTGQGVVQSVAVTGAHSGYNWAGNGTFTLGDVFGLLGSYGGMSEASGNPFSTDNAASFDGSFDDLETIFWNEPSSLSVATDTQVLTVNIDRTTRDVTILNPTSSAVTIDSYTLIGGRGGFDGGGGVAKELSVDGGSLLTINAGQSESVGAVWVQTPFSDASALLEVAGQGFVNAKVSYSGDAAVFGDYDGSGQFDAGDWPAVLAGMVTDLSAEDGVVQYLGGDLTGDGLVDNADFRFFKQTYETAFGPGSFAALAHRAPEPSALLTLAIVFLCAPLVGRRRLALVGVATTLLFAVATGESHAVTTLAIEHFVGDAPISSGPDKFYTSTATSPGGFTLTSLLNGVEGSQLSLDNEQSPANGLGVGQPGGDGPTIGFTRSINDDGSNSESIRLDFPTVGFTGLSQIFVAQATVASGGGSTISISGFESDPLATGTGTISFAGDTLTWTTPEADAEPVFEAGTSTLSLGNPASVSAGGSLVFSNGAASSIANQYGLRGFELASDIQATTLRVDTRTGMVSLKPGAVDREIDYLQVSSPGGGLLLNGYTGLKGADGFPAGDGSATSSGWDPAPSNSTRNDLKAEAFAFGSSLVEAGGDEILLGSFYDTELDLQDLTLTYDLSGDGSTVSIGGDFIEYYASAGLVGDYNNDSAVDAADYTVWRDSVGEDGSVLANRDPSNSGLVGADDYQSWVQNYGATLAQTASAGAVPEPAATCLICVLGSAAAARRRQRATGGRCS